MSIDLSPILKKAKPKAKRTRPTLWTDTNVQTVQQLRDMNWSWEAIRGVVTDLTGREWADANSFRVSFQSGARRK